MATTGIVGRAVGGRWSRAAAALAACAVAAQAGQFRLIAAADAATCCCPHRMADKACGCPVCAHRRLLEAGAPILESCGAGEQAPVIASLDFALLPPVGTVALPPIPAAATSLAASPPPEPTADVPTPPPLARG